jgi:hypothetical protein
MRGRHWRICAGFGDERCGKLVAPPARRCTEHEAMRIAARKRKKTEAARKRPHWMRLRLVVLERDQWRCVLCQDVATTVHLREGASHRTATADQCLSMCKACHGVISGRSAGQNPVELSPARWGRGAA